MSYFVKSIILAAMVALLLAGCLDDSVVGVTSGDPSIGGTWVRAGSSHRHVDDENYPYSYRETWTFTDEGSEFGDGDFIYTSIVADALPQTELVGGDTISYVYGEYRLDPTYLWVYNEGGRYYHWASDSMRDRDSGIGIVPYALWPPLLMVNQVRYEREE